MIIKRNNFPYVIKEYNKDLIDKYKSKNNMLRHARFIPGLTKGIILIDKFSNNLVGYIAWEEDTIIALEVIKEYQRRGVATYLISQAIGNGAIKLSVNKRNKKALELYNSLGWKEYNSDNNMIYMTI